MLSKIWDALQFRVRHWHSAMRGWNEQDIRVIISCETGIWYWALAEFLWDHQSWVCHGLGYVPLPGFICKWKRHWDKDDPEYFAPFEDWYGDDLGSLWHIWICDPVSQFIWKHKGHNEASFELTLDEARTKFAHDPKVYQWVERSLADHKQWDFEKTEEIRAAYNHGELTREAAIEKLASQLDVEDNEAADIFIKGVQ